VDFSNLNEFQPLAKEIAKKEKLKMKEVKQNT